MGATKSVAAAKIWFQDKILPLRTTRAGFSGNRLWKSPRDLVQGNTEDPNGLCGDAAAFVVEAFEKEFGGYDTNDGYRIGLVLWTGTILNHIANVILLQKAVYPQSYKWDSKNRLAVQTKGAAGRYSSAELLRANVFDLYYKHAPQTLEMWWKRRAGDMAGTVKIGWVYNIEDD